MSTDTRLRAEGAIAALDVAGPRIKELEAALAAVTDPSAVHANILRGTLPLTKAQAIHIAGLPADIEDQLTAAQDEARRLRVALVLARTKMAHTPDCASTNPTGIWAERGPWNYDQCKCEIAAVDAALAPAPQEQMNQCDGCKLGLPVENGVHIHPDKEGWERLHMMCVAHKYALAAAQDEARRLRERYAFAENQRLCVGDAGGCDGNLTAMEHEPNCPARAKDKSDLRPYLYEDAAGMLTDSEAAALAPVPQCPHNRPKRTMTAMGWEYECLDCHVLLAPPTPGAAESPTPCDGPS